MSKKTEQRLRESLEFERLVSDLSTEFINVAISAVDSKINEALSALGKFTGADRSFFFRFNREKTEFRISHLWESQGVRKDEVVRGKIVKEYFPWLAENLVAGKDIVIEKIDDLRDQEAYAEFEYCQSIGIQSFVILPIQVADEPLCAIGLDAVSTKKQWPPELLNRLRVIGEVFTNAIARSHFERALQDALIEIKLLKERLEAERTYLQEEIKLEHNFENIIGQSEELKYVLYQVEQVAPTDTSVLLLGETGTGKELVARAIHKLSARKNRVLVKVNCAALPADLIESELFGYEKGAFTGALTTQVGRFELAKGSTIFLDEIGELPLNLQAKLLRVYESGEFERLGNPKTRHSDVRIIAATNRDLETEVRQGNFRKDLWFRLKVFTVTLPPLRQRSADIPLLLQWFMERLSRKMGKPPLEISRNALKTLQNYHWPGNVRELKNMIESALITGQLDKLKLEPFQAANEPGEGFKPLEEMERDYILKVLKAKKWKVQGKNSAAEVLRINPNTLRARINKLGITKPTA